MSWESVNLQNAFVGKLTLFWYSDACVIPTFLLWGIIITILKMGQPRLGKQLRSVDLNTSVLTLGSPRLSLYCIRDLRRWGGWVGDKFPGKQYLD